MFPLPAKRGNRSSPSVSVPWVEGILENPGDDAESPPGLASIFICQITIWRTINSVYIPRRTDTLPRATKGEDLKAAVKMNPDTKKKSKKTKKRLQSQFMRCSSNKALLVSTRLITRFITSYWTNQMSLIRIPGLLYT